MRAHRPLTLALAVLAATLLAAGCTSGSPTRTTGSGSPQGVAPLSPLPTETPAGLATYYTQKLNWQACDEEFECTTFKVPLDYDHPGSGDVNLSAARAKATGDGTRLGSLLLNPGGPGGSAIEYLEDSAKAFDPAVRASYDLVGLDPRGVGRSTPVTCLNGARMDAYTAVDITPDNQSGIDALVAADKEFATACQQQSGAVLGHVSTVEAARDMDVLRALVGDDKLHYLGKSYGTFLGATYAGLYPRRVGQMVLDGALDPSVDAVTGNRVQAGGFETAWNAFAADCVKQDDCPLGTTEKAAGEQLTALFQQVEAHPLKTESGRVLTKSLATTGVIEALYSDFLWPQLRTALASAKAGNGTALLKLSDDYYERSADGSYPNLMAANTAVNCLDLPAPFTGPSAVQQAIPDFEKTSPHFGRDMAWMALGCTYWPVKATGAAHTIRAAGAPPILVIGTTRDPATPYAWARSLAGQLESGRLLTYDGDGHTAYGRHNSCIDTAVNRYLLQGDAPAPGASCPK